MRVEANDSDADGPIHFGRGVLQCQAKRAAGVFTRHAFPEGDGPLVLATGRGPSDPRLASSTTALSSTPTT